MLKENSIIYYRDQLYLVDGFDYDNQLIIKRCCLHEKNDLIAQSRHLDPNEFLEECTIIGEL